MPGGVQRSVSSFESLCIYFTTYVGVDVDFRRRFTGQSDELSWIEGPYHHFAGFLHRSKGGGSGGIVAILHRFNLAEDFLRNTRTLRKKKEVKDGPKTFQRQSSYLWKVMRM